MQQSRSNYCNIAFLHTGLKLHVNIEQYEYVSKLTDEAGARVFIGTQNEMSFPYYTGLSAASGYTTGIMLRKVLPSNVTT